MQFMGVRVLLQTICSLRLLRVAGAFVCVCVYRVDRLDAGYEYELLLIDSETTNRTNDSDKCFHFPSADTHTHTSFKYIKSTKHNRAESFMLCTR